MNHLNGLSVADPAPGVPKGADRMSPRTRAFCERHGLDATTLPVYLASNLDRPVDILRLTPDQYALIPVDERPDTLFEVNGLDHLVCLPA